MKKIALVKWLFVVTIVIGCEKPHRKWDDLNHGAKFQRESPKDADGREGLLKSLNFIRDSLKLDTLDTQGFNGLEIRIWFGYASTYKQQLIVIKNIDDIWSAKYYSYKPVYYNLTDSLLYFEKSSENKQPKSSWGAFMDKLFAYNILTLPDDSSIKNKEAAHDCNGTTFEIATINTYRMYDYSCIAFNVGAHPEFRNVDNIIKTVTKEFDITLVGYQ